MKGFLPKTSGKTFSRKHTLIFRQIFQLLELLNFPFFGFAEMFLHGRPGFFRIVRRDCLYYTSVTV